MSHNPLPGVIYTPTGETNSGSLKRGGIGESMCSSPATGTHFCGIVDCKQATTTIDMLPDDVILQIIDFRRMDHDPNVGDPPRLVWKWHRLAQVCQRWRHIVFASPRRLDIQIHCTYGTPVREILACWPTLPIVVDYWFPSHPKGSAIVRGRLDDWYDTLEALKHPDRVCSFRRIVQDSLLEEMAKVVENPFPVLESFTLHLRPGHQPLPDAFFGGHTPRLQQVILIACPFPTFPRFLQSAKDLVKLRLLNIPENWSISAGMMVAGLAELTKLESLRISFDASLEQQISHPDQRLAVPLTRIVLPSLIRFLFSGARVYMEEFLAQLETPRLTDLTISFFSLELVVQVPELLQFIHRTKYLKLAEFRRARISFDDIVTNINFDCSQAEPRPCNLDLEIRRHLIRWQCPTMIQIRSQFLSQFSHIISHVRDLLIITGGRSWKPDTDGDPTEWLAFFRSFTVLETLRTSGPLSEIVVAALEDYTEDMVAKVLPALQLLNLQGHQLTPGALEKFIAVRELSGRPVTVDNRQRPEMLPKGSSP